MLSWINQSIDLLNRAHFGIINHGPLYGPIENFAIRRDENLILRLETTAAPGATSTAIQNTPGLVSFNTAQVELENISKIKAVLSGVRSHLVNTSHSQLNPQENTLKEFAEIDQLSVFTGDAAKAIYTIEWLENISGHGHIWPDAIRSKTETTSTWTIGPADDSITLTNEDNRTGTSYAAIKLLVEGNTFYVCSSNCDDRTLGIKPGCIIYEGTPDILVRKKIRTALSFALGVYLIEVGHTLYDKDWHSVLVVARSPYSLGKRAFDLHAMPLAHLSDRNWQFDLGRVKLTRMVNALYLSYESLDLGNLSWAYWHARIATVHIAPAHLGAAIEALLDAYTKKYPGTISTKALAKCEWKSLSNAIRDVISNFSISDINKAIISGNVSNINRVPIRNILAAICSAIDIDLGEPETAAWSRRNDAAHGTPIAEGEELAAIKDMKLLMGLFHRLLLRITDASDSYIDYASPHHPISILKAPPSAS